MKCPRCRLINPESAVRCDCGYDFKTGSIEQSYLPPNANSAGNLMGNSAKGSHRKIFWAIIAYGIALPWLVGIAVKLYLQVNGQPTLAVVGFLNPLLLPFSVWLASPCSASDGNGISLIEISYT